MSFPGDLFFYLWLVRAFILLPESVRVREKEIDFMYLCCWTDH